MRFELVEPVDCNLSIYICRRCRQLAGVKMQKITEKIETEKSETKDEENRIALKRKQFIQHAHNETHTHQVRVPYEFRYDFRGHVNISFE